MADIAKIKEIRERTGIGFGDCKKALAESDGDIEKAIEFIRKQSAVKASKKADRTASEGRLAIKIASDGKSGAIAEVNVETDFAARNERFVAFIDSVAEAVLEKGPSVLASLEKERQELVQTIGENITLRRADRVETQDGLVASYLHSNGTVGALVVLSEGDEQTGRDLAMHVTATSPLALSADDIPADVIAKERQILIDQAADSGKPPAIVEKIVEGRMNKFKSESCLLDQPFVKDTEQKVRALLKSRNSVCKSFVRFQVGESVTELDEAV